VDWDLTHSLLGVVTCRARGIDSTPFSCRVRRYRLRAWRGSSVARASNAWVHRAYHRHHAALASDCTSSTDERGESPSSGPALGLTKTMCVHDSSRGWPKRSARHLRSANYLSNGAWGLFLTRLSFRKIAGNIASRRLEPTELMESPENTARATCHAPGTGATAVFVWESDENRGIMATLSQP